MSNVVDKTKYIKFSAIAGIIVILDLISKAIILTKMPLYRSIEVVPGFFSFTHIQNAGGAFGLLANQSSEVRYIFFIIVSSLVTGLVFLLYKNTPKTHSLLAAGFAMIFGGAAGNLIDRIRFGKVVDFLDFYIGDLHWPAFNVADSAITIGIAILIFHIIFKKMPE
ncbi:MAG: signal peptidase II [Desulfobacterales bacterium]|nr:signal peptidase II [Desulfobacterales bacterium]